MPVHSIHYGKMFVYPDSKRVGAFNAQIPTVVDNVKVINKLRYFGTRNYRYPHVSASRFVDQQLTEMYGEERASYIRTIPQFIQRMKFGNQVSLIYTKASSRDVKYDIIRVCWTEFELVDKRYKSNRKSKGFLYNQDNKRQVEHSANLFAASIRAKLTMSKLDIRVLTFEFDLNA